MWAGRQWEGRKTTLSSHLPRPQHTFHYGTTLLTWVSQALSKGSECCPGQGKRTGKAEICDVNPKAEPSLATCGLASHFKFKEASREKNFLLWNLGRVYSLPLPLIHHLGKKKKIKGR